MARGERRARWRGIIYPGSWSRVVAQTGTKRGHWYRLMPRTGTNVHFQQSKGRETTIIGTGLYKEPVLIVRSDMWYCFRSGRCRPNPEDEAHIGPTVTYDEVIY